MTDSEEALSELTRRHDREKIMLLEENKKLAMDLDTVSEVRQTLSISHSVEGTFTHKSLMKMF
jgi:serine/threonine-protein kinase MRCK